MSNDSQSEDEYEGLLTFLRRNRGFDFTGYKRSSLIRRVQKRMRDVKVKSLAEYIDYLEVHPNEFVDLFNTILINVTSFFRDKEPWDYLASEIVPAILADKHADEPIRIWSAGCASGEEPYSIAMMFAEAIGVDEVIRRLKIYATDVDEEALSLARRATYAEASLQSLPEDFRQKYFNQNGSQYSFRADLRRTVIFGRHDIVQDAPIPRLDLLCCRNALMYFNSETQSKILSRLYFALNPKGFLFLGKAEMLLTRSHLFRAVDLKHRIFAKTTELDRSGLRDAVPLSPASAESENIPTQAEQFFNSSQSAELIVSTNGSIVLINDKAKSLFGLLSRDVGRLIKDIEIGFRPFDLQRYVMQCTLEKSPISSEKITRTLPDGSKQCLRALLWPLLLERSVGTVSGIGIRFDDLTETEKVFDDLQKITEKLGTASEELESVREELETTNEELQSSNEELETTNEELQSTNEELETMNEELQSTNTELDTTNQELRQLYDSLNSTHVFLESVLASIGSAVIVVDRELKILHWSDRATNLWGLRADEVKGKNIKDLDVGLKVSELVPELIRIISKETQFLELVLPATNRRGVNIDCAVKLALCKGSAGEPVGVILLMDEQAK